MLRRRTLLRGAFAVAALGLAGTASSAQTAPATRATDRIKLGWVAVSAANSAIWSADAGGYLAKYGIDYELVGIQNSPQAVPAILSGEIPLNCGLSSTDVIASALQGADLTFLAVTINTFPSSIMGQPGLDSLKGMRIGVSDRKST